MSPMVVSTLLGAKPFVPFVIHLGIEIEYCIERPESAWVVGDAGLLCIVSDGSVDETEVIDLSLVQRLACPSH